MIVPQSLNFESVQPIWIPLDCIKEVMQHNMNCHKMSKKKKFQALLNFFVNSGITTFYFQIQFLEGTFAKWQFKFQKVSERIMAWYYKIICDAHWYKYWTELMHDGTCEETSERCNGEVI